MIMEYSDQEQQLIHEMKKSIVNEFRYFYRQYDIGFLANFVAPDMTLEIESLQEAFRVGMSETEKQMAGKP